MTSLVTLVFCIVMLIAHAQGSDSSQKARAIQGNIRLGGDITQWETLPSYALSLPEGDGSGFFTLAWTAKAVLVLGVFDRLETHGSEPEWWTDDSLELFFRTEPKAEPVHFSFSPTGELLTAPAQLEALETATRLSEKRWILELAIPLAEAELPSIEVGDVWHFKIARHIGNSDNTYVWPRGTDIQNSDHAGTIEFVDIY